MTIETFNAALLHDAPPGGWSPALQALWHQGKGDWDRAHRLAQAQEDADGAWVHAHLHRKGDFANARYWYRRAGREPSAAPLDDEFRAIAAALLAAVPPGE